MPSLQGPSELVSLVIEEWKPVIGHPSKEAIAAVVKEAYRISLKPDEARFPRLLFVFPAFQADSEPTFVPFGGRTRYIADLAAVAPAIAPPPFAIVLAGEAAECFGVMRADVGGVFKDGIYVGIHGPGEIEVTSRSGADQQSWFLSGCVCQRVDDVSDSILFDKIFEREDSASPDDWSPGSMIRTVISSVSSRGHGGALLFTRAGAQTLGTIPGSMTFGDPPPAVHRPGATRSQQEARATVIASFSQIDGAMLLDGELNVLAAGVFIETDPGVEVTLPNGEAAGLERLGLGTRHRSAASFCQKNEASGAIVISQDRAIRVFVGEGGRVYFDGPFANLMVKRS